MSLQGGLPGSLRRATNCQKLQITVQSWDALTQVKMQYLFTKRVCCCSLIANAVPPLLLDLATYAVVGVAAGRRTAAGVLPPAGHALTADAGAAAAEAAAEAGSADPTEPVEPDALEVEADADKATDATVGESASDDISDEL